MYLHCQVILSFGLIYPIMRDTQHCVRVVMLVLALITANEVFPNLCYLCLSRDEKHDKYLTKQALRYFYCKTKTNF